VRGEQERGVEQALYVRLFKAAHFAADLVGAQTLLCNALGRGSNEWDLPSGFVGAGVEVCAETVGCCQLAAHTRVQGRCVWLRLAVRPCARAVFGASR
jgi:hypothetical protein